MFTGQIFGKFDKPGFVEVPKSYDEANLWIKSDYSKDVYNNPGKILHLPLTTGESITYNWAHGYSGLEPSALFFTAAPSVSHGFNLKQVDNSLTALYQVIHNPLVSSDKILRLLQDFNVRYIVLHKDAKWEGGEFYDLKQTEEILNKLNFFETSQKFGDLVIYKISDNYFKPKISIASSFDFVYPPQSSSLWPWILSENRVLITDINNKKNESLDVLSTNNTIFPKKSFRYTEASPSSTVVLIDQLISNQNYDDMWLQPLTRLKAIYRTNNEIQGEELNDKLISAGKKILKISRAVFIQNNVSANKNLPVEDLESYADEMKQIFSSNSAVLAYYAGDKTISNIFQVHLYMLRIIANKLQQNSAEVTKIADNFKKSLIDNDFVSSYYNEGKPSDFSEKTVLKFEIPKDSNYELLLTSPSEKDIYLEKYKKMPSIINGKTNYLTGKKTDNIVSLGQISLLQGNNEIELPILYSDNLIVQDNASVKIESTGSKIGYQESKINYVTGGDIYQISFTAKVEKGDGFYMQLIQDTDTFGEKGQINYQVNEFIKQGSDQDTVNYSFPLPRLRATTKNAAVRFLAAYSNNQNLMPSTVLIGNLRVLRLFNEDIFLRKTGEKKNEASADVLINQKSPVLYNGEFHLDKPSFIIFSESYHPNWKLTLSKDGRDYTSTHFLANLYSNAWYIKDTGDYNFKLEFEPQKIVNYGFIIAIISYLGLVIYILLKRFKGHEK